VREAEVAVGAVEDDVAVTVFMGGRSKVTRR
jgi:hypothetical protein